MKKVIVPTLILGLLSFAPVSSQASPSSVLSKVFTESKDFTELSKGCTKGRCYVNGYTKKNGTKVKGYTRKRR